MLCDSVNVEEEFYQQITCCCQLPLKDADALQLTGVLLVRQVSPQIRPYCLVHPARVQEENLALGRDGGKMPFQKGPALFL